jgi:uncharacterized protein (DUF362 family)/Ni,Fe-hydrogenase III small subunit
MPLKVALKKYVSSPESLKQVIELCEGFKSLRPSLKIFIKPNLVMWDPLIPIPPYGMFTTTRIVEDLIILLKEQGCTNVTVAEGSVILHDGEATQSAFTGLGYTTLEKKYGIRLVDLNKSATATVKTGNGHEVRLAQDALETDFFINVPVLKTHAQTKVSLGIKNLKGCLKMATKKQFHDPKYGLENWIQWLPDILHPSLTIIDGIYALERGPLHLGSTAYRKNVLIASTDLLGADLVAARTIGFAGEEIDHLNNYASRSGKPLQLEAYEIQGDALSESITPLKWDWGWTKDNTGPAAFEKMGIKGISVPKYDSSLCSGCTPLANMINMLVISAYKGTPFGNIEILNGKKMQAHHGFEQTVLAGNCIIEANRGNANIKKVVEIAGCPPTNENVCSGLISAGIQADMTVYTKFLTQQYEKYNTKAECVKDFFQCKQ